MFPVDSLSAQYMEHREEVERSRRLALLQAETQKAQAASVDAAMHNAQSQKSHPASSQMSAATAQQLALPQHPAFARPSAGLLGNIFQSFTRTQSSSASSPAHSGASTPMSSPMMTPSKTLTQADMEAMLAAEKRRDADICAMPTW